jgi:hypothetical protein
MQATFRGHDSMRERHRRLLQWLCNRYRALPDSHRCHLPHTCHESIALLLPMGPLHPLQTVASSVLAPTSTSGKNVYPSPPQDVPHIRFLARPCRWTTCGDNRLSLPRNNVCRSPYKSVIVLCPFLCGLIAVGNCLWEMKNAMS